MNKALFMSEEKEPVKMIPAPTLKRAWTILSIETLFNDPAKYPLQKRSAKKWVHLQLTDAEDTFEGFGLSDNQGVYKEQINRQENRHPAPYVYKSETFYLKQKLLASEHPLSGGGAISLSRGFEKTLEAMFRLYEPKESQHGCRRTTARRSTKHQYFSFTGFSHTSGTSAVPQLEHDRIEPFSI